MEFLENVRLDYEQGLSLRKIAIKYGRSHTYWRKKAKEFDWKREEPKILVPKYSGVIYETAGVNDEKEQYELLTPLGARKVEEILNYIGKELYSPTDEANIMMYATFYQRFLKLEKIVQKEGETIVSEKTGNPYFNPSYSALLATTAQLQKLGETLGLSIVTRKRNSLNFGTVESTEPTIFDIIKEIIDE